LPLYGYSSLTINGKASGKEEKLLSFGSGTYKIEIKK
jgi:hypothetical protein